MELILEKKIKDHYNSLTIEELVNEFFSIIDTTESSDSGSDFRPTYINSCRVVDMMKLNELLPLMREKVGIGK